MKLPSLLFFAAVSALPAATLTVTSTADSGAGSLREAVDTANNGDTITFGGAAFTGPENTVTIRLTSGAIDVDRHITIEGIANAGGGNKVVISGDSDASGTPTAGDTHAFRAQAPSGSGTITLDRLTVRDCSSSGAVVVVGTNTVNYVVRRCRFISNTGSVAGVWFSNLSSASFEFDRCRFEGNICPGGSGAIRIDNSPSVSLSLCDFVDNRTTNTSASAGAIQLRDCPAVQIDRCLFSENESPLNGGALFLDNTPATIRRSLFHINAAKSGGAIYCTNLSGPPIQPAVTHCTFSANQTTGAGAAVTASHFVDLLLEHCTVTGNASNTDADAGDAGAVNLINGANVRFHSNLIAGNTDGRASGTRYPDVQLTSGTMNSLGGNVIGDATGSGTTFSGPDDLDGTAASPIPAGVLPLADHGGPTLTHALQPLAAAVDFAKNSTATEDQRAEARPSGSEPDAGAFERQLLSFADWAAARLSAFPVSERQANDDPDLDGLSNGIEFIQGTAPAVANLPLDRVEIDGGGTWYSFTISNEADLDTLTAEIEQSDDLTAWQASPLNGKSLGAVFDSTNATRTRYRLPVSTAGRPKYFFRLNVRPLQLNN